MTGNGLLSGAHSTHYRPLAPTFWRSLCYGAVGGFIVAVVLLGIGAAKYAIVGGAVAPTEKMSDRELIFIASYALALTVAGAIAGAVRFAWPTRGGFYAGFSAGGSLAVAALFNTWLIADGDKLILHPLILVPGAVAGVVAAWARERSPPSLTTSSE